MNGRLCLGRHHLLPGRATGCVEVRDLRQARPIGGPRVCKVVVPHDPQPRPRFPEVGFIVMDRWRFGPVEIPTGTEAGKPLGKDQLDVPERLIPEPGLDVVAAGHLQLAGLPIPTMLNRNSPRLRPGRARIISASWTRSRRAPARQVTSALSPVTARNRAEHRSVQPGVQDACRRLPPCRGRDRTARQRCRSPGLMTTAGPGPAVILKVRRYNRRCDQSGTVAWFGSSPIWVPSACMSPKAFAAAATTSSPTVSRRDSAERAAWWASRIMSL